MFVLRNVANGGDGVIPVNILVGELANLLGFYLDEVVVQLEWLARQESESDRFDLLGLEMASARYNRQLFHSC